MSQTAEYESARAFDLDSLPPSSFLTRAQLAPILGFHIQTLKRWARLGQGPRITYLEKRPRYRVGDVRDWIGGANV